jgi:nucleoside-diphosphate-sugar epimerase
MDLPTLLSDEQELERLLATPYPEEVEAARTWDGDLLFLGAGGKMGPTMAMRARAALDAAGARHAVIAVSRFSDPAARGRLEGAGVRTIACDLLEPGAIEGLPDAPNVFYLAARKFGAGAETALTWVTNSFLPGLVARRYARSRIVAFSTGNVYPFTAPGAAPDESVAPCPVGEYGMSALGRERVFEHFSLAHGTRVTLLRLNYAVEMRYGVLVDLARKIAGGAPIDLSMGHVNVIWEGDAHAVTLRSLIHAASPPFVLNLTGPETFAVRELALELGRRIGREPLFSGVEAPAALLSDARRCAALFGPPQVPIARVLDWIAAWMQAGGPLWSKPTHFQVRDGKF